MQVTSTNFLPLLVPADDSRYGADHLLDDLAPGLAVAYSFGPPYGDRLVTWADLGWLRVSRRALRRTAIDNLYASLDRLRIEGQPPALMLSFGGLECGVLLADEFWVDLAQSVPGELVVGVPARDVVIVTGTQSRPGMERLRRAVDRIFFAGGPHLLSRDLLIWRQGGWLPLGAGEPEPGSRTAAISAPDSRRNDPPTRLSAGPGYAPARPPAPPPRQPPGSPAQLPGRSPAQPSAWSSERPPAPPPEQPQVHWSGRLPTRRPGR